LILSLIDEAVQAGARRAPACEVIGLSARAVERWRREGGGEDRRLGPMSPPANRLTDSERDRILKTVNSPEFWDLSVRQIVPHLADDGIYLASEATIYRILGVEEQVTRRGRASDPRNVSKPKEYVATGPNQVWSWDITYLRSNVTGQFYYLYLILDLFSRKIVGWSVHARQCEELAAVLVETACRSERVRHDQLVLHADNGGPMTGSTLLVKLETLGVARSYSRPGVCDDNPYSEATFRTVKYHRSYPRRPFTSLEAARAWVESFVSWYNAEHLHSGIRYVSPLDRHEGRDGQILRHRQEVYDRARARHPQRWGTRPARNWQPIREVKLNPDNEERVV